MKSNKKGFTLIELIVVLAILAVIAAIAVPTAFGAITDAQIAADKATVESFNSAIRMQGTLLRANKDAAASPDNNFAIAFINAQVNTKNKPQSNGKIGVKWVAPTATSIGYFEVVPDGTNINHNNNQAWSTILNAAVGNEMA
ncbi:MAG: prepilin-type N-terminal cleavage/methylation domain-containing protein, partial [Oscillospiraceae bacterium]